MSILAPFLVFIDTSYALPAPLMSSATRNLTANNQRAVAAAMSNATRDVTANNQRAVAAAVPPKLDNRQLKSRVCEVGGFSS